jgi:OmpA-OmpF porin, OOP family
MKRITQFLLLAFAAAIMAGCVTGYEVSYTNESGVTHSTLNESMLFASGSAVLKKGSGKVLDGVAAELKKSDNKFTVQGHTDSIGSEAANMKLSQKRADAVKAALVKRGIKAERVRAKGYAATRPVVKDAKTAADHQKNRRVVIVFMDDISAPNQ